MIINLQLFFCFKSMRKAVNAHCEITFLKMSQLIRYDKYWQ